jgi:hypothetical protein
VTADQPKGVSEPEAAFRHAAEGVDAETHLEAAWTPEAVAAVERAEAELAPGGGVPHTEVARRTRAMLGR